MALGFPELPCGVPGRHSWAVGREDGDDYLQVDGKDDGMRLVLALAVADRLPSPVGIGGAISVKTLDEALAMTLDL